MKLLTKKLLERFEKLGRQDGSPIVVAKFFNPNGAGTWYATEYDPDTKTFFGFADLGDPECAEWGYFSLDELENFRGSWGLGIERDLYFKQQPISYVCELACRK